MLYLEKTVYLKGSVLDQEIDILKRTNCVTPSTVIIDDHFDFELYDDLKGLLPKNTTVLSDFFFDPVCDDIQPFPAWLAYHDFGPMARVNFSPHDTVDCFNFIANKARPWRVFVVKLLEYFDLSTKSYTLHPIIDNFHPGRDVGYHGTDKKIKKFFKWACHNNNLIEEHTPLFLKQDSPNTEHANHWHSFLKSQVFAPAAVAIITEPYEITWIDHLTYSEKTIYAMLGLNFPLWAVGGIGQADMWKSVGFDVFDDVIDHSYQYHKDPMERSFYAIYDNLEILCDLDKAKKLRDQCADRLIANQQRVYDGQLDKWLRNKVSGYSITTQKDLEKYMQGLLWNHVG